MLEKILTQIGLVLLMRWLSGDKDSSAIETKIFNTTDKDEMIELVMGEVIADVIKDKELDPDADAIIEGLLTVRDKPTLEEFVNKPETKLSMADAIGNILAGIFSFLGFGNKK